MALAQSTSFGWVIYGHINQCSNIKVSSCQINNEQTEVELDRLLLQFWTSDDMNPKRIWTQEEQRAEDIFVATHHRDDKCRYAVQIPRRVDAPVLGNSRAAAKACFLSVERKLMKNPELHDKYHAVFNDYTSKKHLVLAATPPPAVDESYYMQHHAINSNKKGGKFRVVFNASAPTSNGASFNDQQLPGPKLINDIGEFFIRFRLRRFAMTADISQMFRQVRVNPLEWNYQRVIYRNRPESPLQEYIYNVVTWGMASASFNAVRALRQCAIDESDRFPIGAQVVLNDFYIDDLLTGADTSHQLQDIYHQVTKLLRELSKWNTNEPGLGVQISHSQKREVALPIESGVLGMKWSPSSDTLALNIVCDATEISNSTLTKRKVFSITSQIYDPSGLVAPCIVTGKILQQNIWRSGIGWDEIIPDELIAHTDTKVQLHIFTDASEQAMGAAIYLRVINEHNHGISTLITSKSKVAPVKKVTVPRLELTAAHLGAQLYQYTKSACRFHKVDVFFWTDSTIVAHWIKRDPLSDGAIWRHIDGSQNPADLLTRGLSAAAIKDSRLWWHGPEWLSMPQEQWPNPLVTTTLSSNMLEAIRAESILNRHDPFGETSIPTKSKRGQITAMVISCAAKPIGVSNNDGKLEALINRTSDLSKLLRVTSFVEIEIETGETTTSNK